jgi:hypothetical protein
MWAHYAGNHTGFAIGLEPATAFPNPNPKSDKRFLPALKVKYVRRQPRISMSDMDTSNFLTAKMDHWAYEKEWRFLNMPDGAAQRGGVVNGHELLLFDFRPDAIRKIVLGANCAPETVAEEEVFMSSKGAGYRRRSFRLTASVGWGLPGPFAHGDRTGRLRQRRRPLTAEGMSSRLIWRRTAPPV